ncbi:MAG TPA: metabolite traffic protein EboE [Geminicoccaceae bacterium]|nr:metabolite traffic protein EboE [Geminicoccaceae bacterium]
MILDDARLGHLTYCTNIHKGISWPEVREYLTRDVPRVKAAVAPDRPFGLGFRLAAQAASDLEEEAAFAELKALLAEHALYVFTLNGFPYGPFHGVRVKEEVYQPDWSFPERLAYTDRLADLLLRLLPDEIAIEGSISTVPGTFRPLAAEPERVERIVEHLLRHVAHLARLRERSGRTIALALEPEPMCMLETIDETADFIERRLLAQAGLDRLAALMGGARAAAEAAVRRHLGVCYDVCHAAVEFEDAAGSLARLRRSGIGVPKLQLSAALRVPRMSAELAAWLGRFDDGVYLHQVVERAGERLVRHLDLPQALDGYARVGGSAEWRVHCHVPVFLAEAGIAATTQPFLAEILDLHRREPISAHLEVETYTWDVLPPALRNEDITVALARELEWCQRRLAG